MKYNKTFTEKRGFYPKIKYILKNIPDEFYFGNLHNQPCRRPSAIFNISSAYFLDSLEHAIQKYSEYSFYTESKKEYFNDLLEKTYKCISTICSFYDECLLILISLSKPSKNNPKFASDWLKQNMYKSGEEYINYCYEAIKVWQNINNRIKHNNQKLTYVLCTGDDKSVQGFFVEGCNSDKTIGPDETFHKISDGIPRSFSFNRTYILLFLSFYYISDKLIPVVRHHLKSTYNYELYEKVKLMDKDEIKIKNLWEKLFLLNNVYFPDEYKLKYGLITKIQDGYTLKYPINKILFSPYEVTMEVGFVYDGCSTSFKLV